MLGFIITLIVIVIIAAALLAVLRALLALPAMGFLAPYSNLIFALVVLLIVLWAVQGFYTGTAFPFTRESFR